MNPPWCSEVDITEVLVRRLLNEQFPEFSGANRERIGEGWDNAAWLINKEWVFRFPRRQLGADLLPSEIGVLPKIARELPARVPAPEKIGRPSGSYRWPFAGYRRIPGHELCQTAPQPEQRLLLAEQLGRFLRDLHRIPAERAEKLGARPDRMRRLDLDYRSCQARENLRKAAALGLIESPEPWLSLLDRLIKECPEPVSECLVHGDLYSRHVLVEEAADREARLSGVIDWGDLHIGDPAVDLSCAWTLFDPNGRRRLIDAYGNVSSGTMALARFRAIGHSAICLIYGREGRLPDLEHAALQALQWTREEDRQGSAGNREAGNRE